MSIDLSTDNASLTQLQQTPIDTVLNSIDKGLVHLPGYRELYYRWERQQWHVHEIDFVPDRIQWEDMEASEQEKYLYDMSGLFQGEASVANALASYVIAMPEEEMRLYLTTQQADEARHTVFFDRFFQEVFEIDEGSLEETLGVAQTYMNPSSRFILIDSLEEVSTRLRLEPQNLAHLIEGVTLYHVIIEGTMALASMRVLLEGLRQDNIFPGFRGGFTAVARDESRHVIFGVKFLRDMLQRDASHADLIIAALHRYVPHALQALMPQEERVPEILAMGDDPWLMARYAQQSLRKKLKVIGLNNVELPALPQTFNP